MKVYPEAEAPPFVIVSQARNFDAVYRMWQRKPIIPGRPYFCVHSETGDRYFLCAPADKPCEEY